MALALQQARRRPHYGGIAAIVVAAVAVAVLPQALSIVALAGIVLGALLLRHPMVALYLLPFAVPYETVRSLNVGGLNATITEFLLFCAGAAFLMQWALAGRMRLQWAWWSRPLLLFLGVMVLSVSQATQLTLSIKEILKLSEMLLTYLLVLAYVDTPAKVRRLIFLVVLATFSQALLGLAQTFAHFGPASFLRGGALRAAGTFDQPNPFGGYLNLTLPLLLAGVLSGVPLAGRLTRPALVIIGAALLVSQSKGAILAALIALAVLMVVRSRRALPVVGALACVVYALIMAAMFGLLPGSLANDAALTLGVGNVDVTNPTPADWPSAERLAHIEAGLLMFADHPVLGVGIGNYPAAYPRYQVAPVWVNPLGHAHNYYVNVAAETGVIGLAAFLILIVSGFGIVVRLYRLAADPWARALALGALGMLTTVAVHNFVDNVFVHAMEAQVAFIVGLATVACRLGVEKATITAGSTGAGTGAQGANRAA